MSQQQTNQQTTFVTVVTRFGQVMGVYSHSEDAFQVVTEMSAKGQTAELCVKPLL